MQPHTLNLTYTILKLTLLSVLLLPSCKVFHLIESIVEDIWFQLLVWFFKMLFPHQIAFYLLQLTPTILHVMLRIFTSFNSFWLRWCVELHYSGKCLACWFHQAKHYLLKLLIVQHRIVIFHASRYFQVYDIHPRVTIIVQQLPLWFSKFQHMRLQLIACLSS